MRVARRKIIPSLFGLIPHASRHRPSTENPQMVLLGLVAVDSNQWFAIAPTCSRPQNEHRARLSQPRTAPRAVKRAQKASCRRLAQGAKCTIHDCIGHSSRRSAPLQHNQWAGYGCEMQPFARTGIHPKFPTGCAYRIMQCSGTSQEANERSVQNR